MTGGGAVFMSPRMLAWDVVDRPQIARAAISARRHARICEGVAAGLSRLGCAARFRPANDIEIGGLKVSGSSGYAEGRSVALQGTVLIEDDVPAMARALRIAEAALRDERHLPARRSLGSATLRSRQRAGAAGRRPDGGARARHPCMQIRAPAISPKPRLCASEIGSGEFASADRAHRARCSMTRKLLIVLVNTDPRNPEELGAPFYHAAVAAAMDYEVDVICAATAGKLMRKGVAEAIRIKQGHDKTVYDWIRDAHKNGARFWACPANLDLFDMTEADLIPECKGLMGAAAMLQNIMSDDYRVLTY